MPAIMKSLILYHDDCLNHDPGHNHPERADRVRAVLSALENMPGTERLPAPLASREQICRAHDPDYYSLLQKSEPEEGLVTLDPDTFMSAGSFNASLRASGAACFAIDQVCAGKSRNAFCVTRPPGHHAEASVAMGFCLFNHAAVAARHAQAEHGIERVAILDFDVHHGNGTQAIFEKSPEVLYVSSHQFPLYPGTGQHDEVGLGNILNLPLPPNSGSDQFRATWAALGLPAVRLFQPELIIISAGFDAHEKDPLGQLELQDEDFGWITGEIRDLAENLCDGRLISILEGGYDLEALASASRTHVEALTT